ncbi:hypothetical protein LSH36_12g00030 [Paralvinella palmiformis]|uniref:Uncharacterized protein n=1 Tax=Paralvinella palmiformis TaxID=53620 RepID=A0AAD9KDA2_9ANNE|nr:hypothetical protein LSH36_12g00030 [Paralvinella palmiformis]
MASDLKGYVSSYIDVRSETSYSLYRVHTLMKRLESICSAFSIQVTESFRHMMKSVSTTLFIVFMVLSQSVCYAIVASCTEQASKLSCKVQYYRCGWLRCWICARVRYFVIYERVCCKGYHKVDGICVA